MTSLFSWWVLKYETRRNNLTTFVDYNSYNSYGDFKTRCDVGCTRDQYKVISEVPYNTGPAVVLIVLKKSCEPIQL